MDGESCKMQPFTNLKTKYDCDWLKRKAGYGYIGSKWRPKFDNVV